jgi:membrane glycosyltransferase
MSSADHDSRAEALERAARQRKVRLLGEIWGFLAVNKKWWLAPIIVVLLLVGTLVVLGGSAVAPFIYTLF